MEKTIKVICINDYCACLTKGRIYEVTNDGGYGQYRCLDDNGSLFAPFKDRFEIVEENETSYHFDHKTGKYTNIDVDGARYNILDTKNRGLCEEKKFRGMHVPYMRDIVENLHEMKAPSMPEKLRSQSMKVIVLDEVDVYPLTDINLNNEIDSFNRHLKCNTHHIETPPEKKVEYHEPGFKSKWDTVGI